ncbi:prenylated rab acceptor PRA1 [Cantharellus anzutake]|uniref:prenylated rab acceptor PRA1 n=1 Tax=Cantharellus anzutake TaxID=1750568 RepID=UPI001905B0B2|nr:prenylated rab acceptor PRA1 [Cantharellus anzutake]KAF8332700.1 prenylated rab acceptor PRA1 [Cantharellus anzutake]
MEYVLRAGEIAKNFRETRLSTLRPASEFFNHRQLSRPTDSNQAFERITYNTRYFAGNYFLVVAILALYAVLTNKWLLIAIAFIVCGFTAINRLAPEPRQVGDYIITQKGLYIGLFGVGTVLLWLAAPISTFFWIIGASVFLILFHACLIEPGVESEYAAVQDQV